MRNEEDRMTIFNFEYAIHFDARLVALFYFQEGGWKFAGTAKRWDGITKSQLERSYGYGELYVFPFVPFPDQAWEILHRLEAKEPDFR